MPDGIFKLAPGEHVDVNMAGTQHVVRLRVFEYPGAGRGLELRGVNCNLEGEMPGLYYPVDKET